MRLLIVLATAALAGCSDGNQYTLYMTTAEEPRLHVATFNGHDTEAENRSACHQTGEVLSKFNEERFRYWCEKGDYRR